MNIDNQNHFNMKKHFFFYLLASAMLISSCNNNNPIPVQDPLNKLDGSKTTGQIVKTIHEKYASALCVSLDGNPKDYEVLVTIQNNGYQDFDLCGQCEIVLGKTAFVIRNQGIIYKWSIEPEFENLEVDRNYTNLSGFSFENGDWKVSDEDFVVERVNFHKHMHRKFIKFKSHRQLCQSGGPGATQCSSGGSSGGGGGFSIGGSGSTVTCGGGYFACCNTGFLGLTSSSICLPSGPGTCYEGYDGQGPPLGTTTLVECFMVLQGNSFRDPRSHMVYSFP